VNKRIFSKLNCNMSSLFETKFECKQSRNMEESIERNASKGEMWNEDRDGEITGRERR
jgi:hypothetical protein